MKLLFIICSLCLSTLSQASYYYIECSDNTGDLKIYQGHTGEKSTATSVSGNPSKPIKKLVMLDYNKYDFSYTDRVAIESLNTSKCENNIMYHSSQNIYAEKVIITKSDGSLFNKTIIGIAADRKSLPAYLICKQIIKSRPRPMKCSKKL